MTQLLHGTAFSEANEESWRSKVDTLRAQGRNRLALTLLMPRLQGGHRDLETLDRAAMCYFELGDTNTALALLNVMAQNWPGVAEIWAKIGSVRQALGDKPSAIENYKKALEVDTNCVRALSSFNKIEPFARNGKFHSRLKTLLKIGTLTAADRVTVLDTLGQIEKRAGHAKSAFRYFSQSKAANQFSFDPEEMDRTVDAQVREFFPSFSGLELPEGPKIIFVCGMPRSGTTLSENILLQHSQVQTIGESKALSNTVLALRQHRQKGSDDGLGYAWLGRLTTDEVAAFRSHYFELALEGQDKGGVIVDKMPLNCRHIALAQQVLPEARFVFMSRHPLDVGLSNYTTSFNEGIGFTGRLDWLGRMTRSIYRSAQDYQKKLGEPIRVQSYKALVTDPECQVRQLLDHCGLSWEGACLSPEKAEGAVRTASVLQVREKINTDGLGKWKPFETELTPMIDALGGWDWINQWESWDDNSAATGRFFS